MGVCKREPLMIKGRQKKEKKKEGGGGNTAVSAGSVIENDRWARRIFSGRL